MLLTSLAMIASACVVVWVVSGYDAMVSRFGDRATEYLGRYDLFLVPDSLAESSISLELIDAIRKDSAVAELEPALQATVRVEADKPIEMNIGMEGPEMAGPGRGGPGSGARGRRGGGLGGPGGPGGPGMSGPGMSGPPGGGRGRPPRGMFFGGGPKLVGTQATTPPYELLEGRWIKHDDPALREAVISSQSAEQLQVKLGDAVFVISGTKEYRLKIIGIVAQATSAPTIQRQSSTGRPMMSGPGATMGPATSALYVPRALAEKISRQPGKVNLVSIKLREGTKAADFRTRWLSQVAQAKPAVLLVGTQDITGAMEEGMMAANARRQAWAATGMSLLAALFIIFTTLSMGVHERIRQFAMMRAVGLTRFQVACVIAVESLILGLIGWGGGLAAGWGLLTLLSQSKPDLFQDGASLGVWCVLLTGGSAFGGALFAAILPAWQVTRVQPLEAMSPRHAARPGMGLTAWTGLAGMALIAVNPLLVYVLPVADVNRYAVYMAVGCTSMAVGFLLLAPLAIVVTEAVFGPLVAQILGLEPRLLRSHLSSNLWRTLGTTVALTVGLGLYVSMMVWGYSMLQPFKPGDWVPDMLAAFQMGALPEAEIDAVRHIPGVIPEQCIPLAVEQPRLAGDITGSQQGNSVTRQDNVILIGLDPLVAFGGPKPLLRAEFVEGSPEEAIAKLKQGRYCVVPDHFLAATGLKIGDRFGMIPPESPDKPVEYTIAAAVSLPGWHWMTKFSGLRRRSGRSAAMVFAPYDDVRRDFGIKQINFFWMNVDTSFGAKHLDEVVKAEAARKAAMPAVASPTRGSIAVDLVVDAKRAAVVKIGEALQPIAERYLGVAQPVNAQGTWAVGAAMFGQSVRISTPDEVRTRILARADDMIWAMCQLPLITLLVTSLGVINTIMASVRARRWELGVLRSLGITRWAMTRMILAEGLLIGVVACLISLAFGVMAGWCGSGISQYVSFFGGMATPLFVPWSKLAVGFGATLLLCLAASLWPAFTTGRSEPLRLLQAGRAAM
jgi:putative ABC transport system permease protein